METALLGTFMSASGALVMGIAAQKKVGGGFVLAGLLLTIGLALVV